MVFVLFIYDSDECSTGFIKSVHKFRELAEEAGEAATKDTGGDYYVVVRSLRD